MGFDDPDMRACAQIVEKGDPQRFRAVMAAPVAARLALFPLFAANVEIARAPWVTQEPMIAEMRLQWWRDAVEEIGKGGIVRRHEVVTPLALLLDPKAADLLDQLIVARRWDIYKDPFEDAAHFTAYLEQTSGHLMRVSVMALGGADQTGLTDIGYAMGLANFLMAIPALEAAKRVPLVDGRPEAIVALAQGGLARLDAGRRAVTLNREQAAALLPAWQARVILQQAARDPAQVAAGALGLSGFRDNLRLLWQAQSGRF